MTMMTKCQLIVELKKKGIKGYSKLNRAQMVKLLHDGRAFVKKVRKPLRNSIRA
jgi:hypothetical protein